jgi:hypothetical protein
MMSDLLCWGDYGLGIGVLLCWGLLVCIVVVGLRWK